MTDIQEIKDQAEIRNLAEIKDRKPKAKIKKDQEPEAESIKKKKGMELIV